MAAAIPILIFPKRVSFAWFVEPGCWHLQSAAACASLLPSSAGGRGKS
jgi:hypothetical protein